MSDLTSSHPWRTGNGQAHGIPLRPHAHLAHSHWEQVHMVVGRASWKHTDGSQRTGQASGYLTSYAPVGTLITFKLVRVSSPSSCLGPSIRLLQASRHRCWQGTGGDHLVLPACPTMRHGARVQQRWQGRCAVALSSRPGFVETGGPSVMAQHHCGCRWRASACPWTCDLPSSWWRQVSMPFPHRPFHRVALIEPGHQTDSLSCTAPVQHSLKLITIVQAHLT